MTLPIQAIVCAVDFSPFTPLVIGRGATLARRTGKPLYLFHAVHAPSDQLRPTPAFERRGDPAHISEEARQRMHGLMENVDVAWEALVRKGDPVEQLLSVIHTLPPCLVISASHGVSGFRRLFIGTVVERMTRALTGPMLVVKAAEGGGNDFDGFRSAVISCDSKGHWRRLAPLITLLIADNASSIHLVHAMEGPLAETAVHGGSAPYAEVQQTLQDRYAAQFRQQGRSLFPEVETLLTTVAPGVPEEMALKVAREQMADLIAVGVRHSGPMERLISGSTTEALLRHAPCCVLAVPESSEPETMTGDGR